MPTKTQLNDEFAASLRGWMPKHERYLVAVSGGLDSMVLLRFLDAIGYDALVVGHVNHQLRGAESLSDAAFVSATATELGVECEIEDVDVESYMAAQKCSVELAARELRYESLSRMMTKHGCAGVVTAHHADDQVETVLMNLFRGSGMTGLTGMDQFSVRQASGLVLFRPLLSVTRAELERYASDQKIAFRQDESNFDNFALRNRVRNQVIPALNEAFDRDVSPAVLRAVQLAARDESWIAEELGEIPRKENGLDVEALRAMPRAKRDRLLLGWFRECHIPDCGFEEVTRVSDILMSDENPAKTNLPNGFHARRRAGVLFLEKGGEAIGCD